MAPPFQMEPLVGSRPLCSTLYRVGRLQRLQVLPSMSVSVVQWRMLKPNQCWANAVQVRGLLGQGFPAGGAHIARAAAPVGLLLSRECDVCSGAMLILAARPWDPGAPAVLGGHASELPPHEARCRGATGLHRRVPSVPLLPRGTMRPP